jgi:hypothetical protein
MAEYRVSPEQEQALARLKCAHCQSLINCDALAQSVLAELQLRYRVDHRCGDGLDVTNPELITAVREGIDRFLRDRSNSVMNPTRRRGRKMSIYFETIQTLRRRFWQWLKDQIAQDVPETDGLCEYDCRKQQCTQKSGRPASAESTKLQENCGRGRAPRREAKQNQAQNFRRLPSNSAEKRSGIVALSLFHNLPLHLRSVVSRLQRRASATCPVHFS